MKYIIHGTIKKDLGSKDTLLGIGTKIGTLCNLQVRNKIKELGIRNKNKRTKGA